MTWSKPTRQFDCRMRATSRAPSRARDPNDEMSQMIAIPHIRPLAAVVALGAAPFAATTLRAQQGQHYTIPGDDIAIYNLVGKIRVEGGTTGETSVDVTRQGPDAAKLTVRTGQIRGREALRVIYPSDRIVFDDGRSRWRGRTNVRVNEDRKSTRLNSSHSTSSRMPSSA